MKVTDNTGAPFEESFVISVVSRNTAPTNLALSNTVLQENQPQGTVVGQLTTTDADFNESFTYALVEGTNDDDNDAFEIESDQLKAKATFDYESKSTYKVRIQSQDNAGATVTRAFVIAVADANDAPHTISLSNDIMKEHQETGTMIGYFETEDQDPVDTHTYSLVSGDGSADNALFEIVDDELMTKGVIDFETQAEYSIRVRTTDPKGGTLEKTFQLTATPDAALELFIPTAFTPNADGYNDLWVIDNIGAHDQIIVQVYEQSGKRLYNSVGYETPWDGTYKGQDLPIGTYYYIFKLPASDANPEDRKYTGSVMIIR